MRFTLCPWAGASVSSAPYPGEAALPAAVLPSGCRVTHAAGFLSQPLAPPGLSRSLPPFLGREGCEIPKLSGPRSPAIAELSCAGTSLPRTPRTSRAEGAEDQDGGVEAGPPAWPQSSSCPRWAPEHSLQRTARQWDPGTSSNLACPMSLKKCPWHSPTPVG